MLSATYTNTLRDNLHRRKIALDGYYYASMWTENIICESILVKELLWKVQNW